MSKTNFFGLSLPDRLNQAGTYQQFSHAVQSGDASRMSTLLQQVDYSAESADATAVTFLNDPKAFPR